MQKFLIPAIGRYTGTAAIVAVGLILTACASAPAATPASLTTAKATIANAEQSDARRYAGADLDEANQKLAQAEKMIASEQLLKAERLAKESQLASEFAMARTEAAKAAAINRQLEQDARALNEELDRTGDNR